MTDRSTHATVVEYAVREMMKGKSPRVAAQATAKKHSGYENMFFGPGVTTIDASILEEQLWERLTNLTIKSMKNMREGFEHFALDGTLQHFAQKQSIRLPLKKRVIDRLGYDPFINDDVKTVTKKSNPRRHNVDWRSPWVVGGVVVGGVALGLGISRIASAQSVFVDCSGVGEHGGVVAGVRYLERMRGGAAPGDRVPMVVLFHALGASPEGYASGLSSIGRARLILPEGGIVGGGGHMWFPEGIKGTLSDGFDPTEQAAWQGAGDRIANFIRAVSSCRPTLGRPIVTGSSQGGEMTLLQASSHAGLVSGAVALNADLPQAFWNRRMAPTAMLNGTGDTTVPYDWAKAYADEMVRKGAPLTFRSYPSQGHDLTNAQTHDWRQTVAAMVAKIS